MINQPSSAVHTIRLPRRLMPTTKALAASNHMTVATYVAGIIEQIAGEQITVVPVDRVQTRIDIALSDELWQKAMRVAAQQNFRSLGDFVAAQIEQDLAATRDGRGSEQ